MEYAGTVIFGDEKKMSSKIRGKKKPSFPNHRKEQRKSTSNIVYACLEHVAPVARAYFDSNMLGSD